MGPDSSIHQGAASAKVIHVLVTGRIKLEEVEAAGITGWLAWGY